MSKKIKNITWTTDAYGTIYAYAFVRRNKFTSTAATKTSCMMQRSTDAEQKNHVNNRSLRGHSIHSIGYLDSTYHSSIRTVFSLIPHCTSSNFSEHYLSARPNLLLFETSRLLNIPPRRVQS